MFLEGFPHAFDEVVLGVLAAFLEQSGYLGGDLTGLNKTVNLVGDSLAVSIVLHKCTSLNSLNRY
jgi:hypothetical protein